MTSAYRPSAYEDTGLGRAAPRRRGRGLRPALWPALALAFVILAPGCKGKSAKEQDPKLPTAVSAVTFDKNGTTLAVAAAAVKLYDPRTGKCRLTIDESAVSCLAFYPDGKKLVGGSMGASGQGRQAQQMTIPAKVFVWDAETGKVVHTLEGHQAPVTAVAVSPDGKTVASVSGSPNPFAPVFEVKLWNAATGEPLADLNAPKAGGDAGPAAGRAGRGEGGGGNRGGGRGGPPVMRGGPGRAAGGHTGRVTAVAFAPDGKTLATGSTDQTIILWDVAKRHKRATLKAGSEVGGVAFAPDGKTLAAACSDEAVRLWETDGWKEQGALKGHKEWVNAVAFSRDSKTLASGGGDAKARVWDVAARKERFALDAGKKAVKSVAFGSGTTLATGDEDGTARLWDAATGKEGRALE